LITLNQAVSPGTPIIVNNSALGYTISGSGSIGGAGLLSKNGTGTLTLSTIGNNYSGGTDINAGTLALGNNDVLPDTGLATVIGTLNMGGYSDTVGR